jgi:hypothetical protein
MQVKISFQKIRFSGYDMKPMAKIRNQKFSPSNPDFEKHKLPQTVLQIKLNQLLSQNLRTMALIPLLGFNQIYYHIQATEAYSKKLW